MAKWRADCRLLMPDQAAATDYAANLDARLQGRARFAVDVPPTAVLDMTGQWVVRCEARFETKADADDISAWVQNAWNSGRPATRPLAGSWVRLHLCTHEETTPVRCDSGSQLTEVVKA